jgi:hypothetical protein
MGTAISTSRLIADAGLVSLMALAVLAVSAVDSAAAAGRRDLQGYGTVERAAAADPAIVRALRQISLQRIQHTVATLVAFRTRNTLSSMDRDLAHGEGINAAADWIESQLRDYSRECGGCLEVKRDTFTESVQQRIPRPTVITNIYAVLHGSDPSQAARVYLVTGHYDSRASEVLDSHVDAPGANDDASGVAVSLECARVLAALHPPATMVFATVAGEEQGLNGSRHLARLAKESGWQVQAALDNDIVGGNTTPGDRWQDKSAVRVFSEGLPAGASAEQLRQLSSLGYESDSPSRELARAIVDVAGTYAAITPVLELRRDRFLRGGDHQSFNEEGFAAVRFTEWREDYNHQHQDVRVENGVQYGDLLKFVDFRYIARVTELNAAALAALAYAPPAPVNVRILTRSLDNDSTLQWQGVGAGVRYEVVWRELGAAQWQRFSAVTGESATVPISKDNVIFGVRSVDAAGHRSPAVVPLPER